VQFLQLHKLLDLDLGSGRGHTGAHMWSRSTTHQIRSKSKKTFSGHMDGRMMYIRTDTPEFQSIRPLPCDDLKKLKLNLNQHSSLRTAHVCVCISLCTTVTHNAAQNSSDNLHSYPPQNHHCSDAVWHKRFEYDPADATASPSYLALLKWFTLLVPAFVSDIAIFVLKRDVKLQLTN